MSETIKIEIEIPPPPEGWGEVEFRYCSTLEKDARCWTGIAWVSQDEVETSVHIPVARKLPPPWTPPCELVATLKPGWLTRDSFDVHALHARKPKLNESHWTSPGAEWRLSAINTTLLPPLTIPWEQCCFKIGAPLE